jgi:hypothetical protein
MRHLIHHEIKLTKAQREALTYLAHLGATPDSATAGYVDPRSARVLLRLGLVLERRSLGYRCRTTESVSHKLSFLGAYFVQEFLGVPPHRDSFSREYKGKVA